MVKVAEYIDIYGHHYTVYERKADKIRIITRTTMGKTHETTATRNLPEDIRPSIRRKEPERNSV